MKYKSKSFWGSIIAGFLLVMSCGESENEKVSSNEKPNIVIIYMDDLGYGDISANGATEIVTPNIDALAKEGVRFTNAYSSSATCTPSRYALLTGVYPWKNEKARILPGTAPLIIDTAQLTLAGMLKKQGYYTGIVGKWHLGLGEGKVNWNEKIAPGPNELGFDYSYILPATQDRVPTVYIKNGHVVGLDTEDPIEINYRKNFEGEPTAKSHPEMLTMKWEHGHNNSIVNGIPRIGFMKGGEEAKWSDVDMADHLLEEAKTFVRVNKDEPFFLYYAFQQPHVPRTPHPRFVGRSGMGPRGDVILEADWCVGEFINTLEEERLLSNTLLIFTSDNGPVLNDGYYDDAVEKIGKHNPSGPYRGGKYSLFEAGTHVPFITYWKGNMESMVSNALVSQLDLLSSLAKLTGSESRGIDSEQLLDVLLGKETEGRNELIIEASTKTALRKGDWVLIPPYKGPRIHKPVNIELGNDTVYQLYNIKKDIGQKNNLAITHPEKLNEMMETYSEITEKGL